LDQPHTNAYRYWHGGAEIGRRRAKLKEPADKARYDRQVDAMASGWARRHGTALRAGYKLGQHGSNPKIQIAASTGAAAAGATGVLLHRHHEKKEATMAKSAFGIPAA